MNENKNTVVDEKAVKFKLIQSEEVGVDDLLSKIARFAEHHVSG